MTGLRGRALPLWIVRELPSKGPRAAARAEYDIDLLFQCAVPGVGAEIRRSRRPLESLSDAALSALLEQGAPRGRAMHA